MESKIPEDIRERAMAGLKEIEKNGANAPGEVAKDLPPTISEPDVGPRTEPPQTEVAEEANEAPDFTKAAESLGITEAPEPPAVNTSDFDFNFDISSIEILHTGGMEKNKAVENVLRNRPTFSVVALQSFYAAHMSALCLEDKARLIASTDNPHDSREKLYRIMYDHIEKMSVPKPKFDDWLKLTSFHDVDTVLFGIYSQTYPDDSDFGVTCEACGNKVDVKVGPKRLLRPQDPEAGRIVQEVINQDHTWDSLLGRSQVQKTTRIALPDSKLVLDIVTPSLADHLRLLKMFNNRTMKEIESIVGLLLFVKNIMVPDIEKIKETGRAIYYEVNDRETMLKLLAKLSEADGNVLDDKMEELRDKYRVDYRIPEMICASCGHEIASLGVDMEVLLFTQMASGSKRRQEKG